MRKKILIVIAFVSGIIPAANAQHSVARQWNEAQLAAIRINFAKPTVHARNLFHVSMAMYDAWAAYDSVAKPFLLGDTVGGFICPFTGVSTPSNIDSARNEAISYAAYRVLRWRYDNRFNPFCPAAPPNRPATDTVTLKNFANLFLSLGYDTSYYGNNYASGNPADLGNYIAEQIIAFGLQDGANEVCGYSNQYYAPVNQPLVVKFPGDTMTDPNRWQPLALDFFIDQNGNLIPGGIQGSLSPEWGNVTPFALHDSVKTVYSRNGDTYNVYQDPGPPPYIDSVNGDGLNDVYKWTHTLVATWSSHLDPGDSVMWDVSPNRIGNVQSYPATYAGHPGFYDLLNGGDYGTGYTVNPVTGQPYANQWVPRGDYTRVLAEFWADGPSSETPPGHWYTILNYVHDHPMFVRRWGGKGPVMDDLEWCVKTYFTLGGALHDAAICAWGSKGYYDSSRPISAIRYMAGHGQSSDTTLPNYSPKGIPLIPGYIEVVQPGDPLEIDSNGVHTGEIKVKSWRGFDFFYSSPAPDPLTQEAGVGWILASEWMPYQRSSFVTPPFPGYISGHSTFSRTAAEVMARMTGDEYFPGGMGEFHAAQNSYLVFEDGPSVDVTLQWAKYKDASDQCSLSRIWGGIHPPADDIPGRLLGMKIGPAAFIHAERYFDSEKPQVISVIPNLSMITDANTGAGAFSLTIGFSEMMDTTVKPHVTFPVENPLAKTLSFKSSAWLDSIIYQITYDVIDSSESLLNIDVRVEDAQDLVGNKISRFDAADNFRIDTENPSVVSLTPNHVTLSDNEVGDGAFSITVAFDENMDTAFIPEITFPAENPLANTLTLSSAGNGWISETTYAINYDVADFPETLPNVDVQVASYKDAAGNDFTQFNSADVFSIDTKNPGVVSVTPSKQVITFADAGTATFSFTVLFDEAMDTSVKFPIAFPSEDPSSTVTYNSGSSEWTSTTNYIAKYDVANSSQILTAIDLEVATACTDNAGNVQLPFSDADKFSIDMSTGVEEFFSERLLEVYPNPAEEGNRLTVELVRLNDDALVQLFNPQGKLVRSEIASAPVTQLDISELASGLYLLRVAGDNWEKSVRVQLVR